MRRKSWLLNYSCLVLESWRLGIVDEDDFGLRTGGGGGSAND
jgi:hypothetical protein